MLGYYSSFWPCGGEVSMILGLGSLQGVFVASDRLCKPFQCAEQLLKQLKGDASPEGAEEEGGRGTQKCVGFRDSQFCWLKLPDSGGWYAVRAVSTVLDNRLKALLCYSAPPVFPMQ